MASEIVVIEQRLKDLKAKNENLDKAVAKLHFDIIKAENKLSKKQSKQHEKVVVVEEARKALEEAQLAKESLVRHQDKLNLAVMALLG